MPTRIPLHPCEIEELAVTLRKEVVLQYLPKMIQESRHSGFVMSLQANYANSAWLII